MVSRGVIGRGRSSVKFRFGGSDLNLVLGRLAWRLNGKLEAGGLLRPTGRASDVGSQGGSADCSGNIRWLGVDGKQTLGQSNPAKIVMDHGVSSFFVDQRQSSLSGPE